MGKEQDEVNLIGSLAVGGYDSHCDCPDPLLLVYNRRVNNFTTDIKDSEAYLHLLNQIADREAGVTMEGLHVSRPGAEGRGV